MFEKTEALLKSVLSVFYQSFWFSLLIAFLCMFFFFSVKENGLKGSFIKWWNSFKIVKAFSPSASAFLFHCSHFDADTVQPFYLGKSA